ncbi:hypothetical protein DPEC_G00001220 [Dallia pectoralis]|uniref:Uncharacterized protein n=1 Tax=Dallia pectoralis TaxID=75939 RepID=A0ACC2HIW2_DALPE|nr:hypothetical protein DPEC_G00001220 [Dallia pectoralis]
MRTDQNLRTEKKWRVRENHISKDGDTEAKRRKRCTEAENRHAGTVEAKTNGVAGVNISHGKKCGAEQNNDLRILLKKIPNDKSRLIDAKKEEEEDEKEEEEEENDSEEEEDEEEEDEEEEEEEEGTVSPTNQTLAHTSFRESLPGACKTPNGQISCRGIGMTHLPIIRDLGVTILDLAENNISIISSRGFFGLPYLESINLSRNQLEDHSLNQHLFFNLTGLRRLNLDGNQLTRVPSLPPSLEELKINDNKITGLTHYNFNGLLHLLSLELENNGLHVGNVSPLTFKPLRMVQYLRLGRNRFRSIPFGLPISLQELRLQANQLQNIPEGVLSKLVKLRVLDFSHNLLHESTIAKRAWVKLA